MLTTSMKGVETMLFKQRRLALSIESEILPNGVRIKEKDLFSNRESVVPFEHISDQIVRSFVVSKLFIAITLGMFVLFGFNIYDYYFPVVDSPRGPVTGRDVVSSFMWLAIAAIGTWMRSARYIGIVCTGVSLFFFDSKGKDNPADFMERILRARNGYFEYLRSQYTNQKSTQQTINLGGQSENSYH